MISTRPTLACVASVSSRVIARKVKREQKKKNMEGGGGGEKGQRAAARPPPPPFLFCFCSRPNFLDASRGNACYAG